MPVITIGTAGAVWGLTAETGIVVQSAAFKVSRETNMIKNEVGEFVGGAFYNPLQKISMKGVRTASLTTGVATTNLAWAQPGVAMLFANTELINGITTGGIYVDSLDVDTSNSEFKSISIEATRYPLIA